MADQGAEGLLSPWLRRQRIAAAQPHLGGRVLDFGCGVGALASSCRGDAYLGIDVDGEMIALARSRNPGYRFAGAAPDGERFDTVVALAVIEHMHDPAALLRDFASRLEPAGRIVLTTPHPSVDWMHTLGAKLGLFSSHANEEHEELIDLPRIRELAAEAGLRVAHAQRFLFGLNQLFVLDAKS